jgi:hypothetical protein
LKRRNGSAAPSRRGERHAERNLLPRSNMTDLGEMHLSAAAR